MAKKDWTEVLQIILREKQSFNLPVTFFPAEAAIATAQTSGRVRLAS